MGILYIHFQEAVIELAMPINEFGMSSCDAAVKRVIYSLSCLDPSIIGTISVICVYLF